MNEIKPVIRELEPGTYLWCRCGRTKAPPICDGAHEGTPYTPLEFRVRERKRLALCTCKRTKNAPICDGSHTKR